MHLQGFSKKPFETSPDLLHKWCTLIPVGSSMVVGRHEQLARCEVQDKELAFVKDEAEVDPDHATEPLHRSWPTLYRDRRISPSGEKGGAVEPSFVQQSTVEQKSMRPSLLIQQLYNLDKHVFETEPIAHRSKQWHARNDISQFMISNLAFNGRSIAGKQNRRSRCTTNSISKFYKLFLTTKTSYLDR